LEESNAIMVLEQKEEASFSVHRECVSVLILLFTESKKAQMSSLLSSLEQPSKEAAVRVISKSSEQLKKLLSVYETHFASSQQRRHRLWHGPGTAEEFDENNAALVAAVQAAQDAVHSVLSQYAAIERYLRLSLDPALFQQEAVAGISFVATLVNHKLVQDTDKLYRGLEELSKFERDRVNALQKCSPTSTGHNNNNRVRDFAGDDDDSSQDTGAIELQLRQQAVTAVDVLCRNKAKQLISFAINSYTTVIRAVEEDPGRFGFSGSEWSTPQE
jgi:hypothetical protein